MRALVHRSEQAQPVQHLGAQEIMVGDMRDQGTMMQATLRVRAVYHIPPNMSPDEVAIGRAALTAACSAGVERFVYHSVLHPQTEDMPHHWHKMRVEELLLKSGLAFTVLQPTVYMQNVLAQWHSILDRGVYPTPYAAETRLSLVDLEDVAAVAAVVLTETGHVGATYELVGTEPMSQHQVAGILSEQLGRPVRAMGVQRDVWRRQSGDNGLGQYQLDTLVKMFEYYEQYGLEGNPSVLGWLLGRAPTSFSDFVRRLQ